MISLGQLGLYPRIYAPGTSGVPATTRAQPDLRWRMRSLEWSISDQFGFESCAITFPAREDEALYWLEQLMSSVVIFDYDAERCWEGYLLAVEVRIGSETHSRSLDGMQNRVICRYTTVLGTPGVTAAASEADSVTRYGTKDGVVTLAEDTATAAAQTRDAAKAALGWPVRETRAALQTEQAGAADVTLRFEGWYGTLGWVLTSRTDTTTEATGTQIGALIGTSSPGIGATNAFLSTTTDKITSTGVSASRKIEADTPYRSKIEALANQGNSSSQRLAWGVYENRVFYLTSWAGSTPNTIHYFRSMTDSLVRNAAGSILPYWRVRPNKMVQIREFVPSVARVGSQTPDRYPVGRVTFTANEGGLSLTLDPPESTNLDARLARLTGE